MPWIDDAVPVSPTITILKNGVIELTNNGPEKIKSFGVFILDKGTELKLANAQLVQVIVSEKTARFSLSNVPDIDGKRVCVGSVDRNNNVSELIEINF